MLRMNRRYGKVVDLSHENNTCVVDKAKVETWFVYGSWCKADVL